MSQWGEAAVTGCVEMGAPGPGLRIDYVRTGKGVAVPRRFEAHFSSPAEPLKALRLTIGVSLDGVPECAEVAISCEPGAPALTRTDLRVPLRRLMDQAVDWIARPAEFDAVGNVVRLGARSSVRAGAVSAALAPRRAQRSLTPELLAQVADTYRETRAVPRSKRFGRPRPTQAVADKFTASYSTAAKWVTKARDAGLLEGGRKDRTRAASVRFTQTTDEGNDDE
jgi:hypothetical protein